MNRTIFKMRLALQYAWALLRRILLALGIAAGAFFALRAIWARADLGVAGRIFLSALVAVPAGIGVLFDLGSLPAYGTVIHAWLDRTRDQRLLRAALLDGAYAGTAIHGITDQALLARLARGDAYALSPTEPVELTVNQRLAALAQITDMDVFRETISSGWVERAGADYDWHRFSIPALCILLQTLQTRGLRERVFFRLMRMLLETKARDADARALCVAAAKDLGLWDEKGFCPRCAGRNTIALDAERNRGAVEEYGVTHYFDGKCWVDSEEPFYRCSCCGESRFGDFGVSMQAVLVPFL